MLRSSRVGAAVVLVLAIANGFFLYFLPARAEPDYAWPIAPPVNAAFMGAGYLAGVVAAALSLRARHWRSTHSLVGPLAILSVGMLAATVIHADRFRWDYAAAWAWTLVYGAIPPGAALLWLRQTRAASPAPPRDARLRWVRRLSWPLGALFALLGVALVATPQLLLDAWPWPITPLLARAFGSWYLLTGTLLVFAAATVGRPHEVPIPYATIATWSALVLLLPLIYPATMRPAGASLALGLVVHSLALVLSGSAVASGLILMRRDAQRL